jgi:hypothetical protein
VDSCDDDDEEEEEIFFERNYFVQLNICCVVSKDPEHIIVSRVTNVME